MPTPGVVREFIGMSSPTARRAGAGGHPCQGLYHRGVGRKPKVAIIATHYQIDFSEHYLADYVATRGIGFLGWNTRFRGFESSFLLDHALVDIGVGVKWLREIQGVETIVLLGNSGGGSLMAAYQSQAVEPNVTPLEGMRPAAGLGELPPADGYIATAAHPGRPEVLTNWMDGAVLDESDPLATDPDLDLFDERNGPPYSADFVARYRSAQIARNHAITDWAETELKRVQAAGFSDRPFTVMRTWADPRMVDPTIEPTKRQPNLCYAGVPMKANRSAHGIAAACTLRSWLGMWSLKTAQTRAEPHLARINCPALVINAEQDTGVFPSDAQRDLRRPRQHRQDHARHRYRPLLHDARGAQRAGGHHREVDRQAVAVRVLAHFLPGETVLGIVAPESDWLDVRWCHEDDDETLHRELAEAEVIWHVLRPLPGEDLRRAPKLRLVHKLGAGVNTIDVDTATELGIAVANMPGANAPSVAEGTVLLMLAALRRLPTLDRATRHGRGWPTDPTLAETVRDIGSCTVGLVGYGNIARRVERILLAMDATVLHTNTSDDGTPAWRSLPDLLAQSDIVSLHLPLTPDTAKLINRATLDHMKPDALLVNTSRGGIVDEPALVDALCDGRLAAAGLDVFAAEPVAADNPLLQLDNVVVTPHVTWVTVDTMRRYLTEAVDNCRRLHNGQDLVNVVNGRQDVRRIHG